MKTLFLIIQRPRKFTVNDDQPDTIGGSYLNIESASREFARIAHSGAYRNFITYHLVSIEIASEKELASIQ